ncbi:MAG: hypothetical protein ACQKBV_06140 [Puniceicoccales bacterium]
MKHDDDECVVELEAGRGKRDLVFNRIKFNSGSKGMVYRWIYNGKVLVRTENEPEKKRKRKDDDDEGERFRLSFALK